MDDAELARRADANYINVWTLYGAAHDRGEVRERAGLRVVSSGTAVAMFNNAFVTRPLPDPHRQIAEAAAFFDERGLPFCVRVREGLDPASERACEALGMPYGDTVPGMALADISAQGATVEGLDIRRATDARAFAEHLRLCVEVFGIPPEVARVLFPERLLHVDDAEFYVGYVDGRAIATSALMVTDRVAGVYNVTTAPAYRGRGIGEAMTWHCVRRGAAMGCVMSALQASAMGRPVYERMGYRLVSPYRTFHRPGV